MLHLCCESALIYFCTPLLSLHIPALATESLQAVLAWLFTTGSQQMPLVNCDRCGGTVPSTTEPRPCLCTGVVPVSSRSALQQPAAQNHHAILGHERNYYWWTSARCTSRDLAYTGSCLQLQCESVTHIGPSLDGGHDMATVLK